MVRVRVRVRVRVGVKVGVRGRVRVGVKVLVRGRVRVRVRVRVGFGVTILRPSGVRPPALVSAPRNQSEYIELSRFSWLGVG